MFDKPEEIMMAVLFAVWVALTYFVAAWLGAGVKYVLLITGFTAGWAVISFLLWKSGYAGKFWPLLLALLTACWWPWLDSLALRSVVPAAAEGGVMVVNVPWYASWTFKVLLAVVPLVGGYTYMWRQKQKPRFD